MSICQFILELCKIVVPSTTTLIAYVLGRKSTRVDRATEKAKMQFENFYLPYMQSYIKGMMWEIRFSELSLDARSEFLNLLMKNFHYAYFSVQNLIPDFYTSFLELIEEQEGRPYLSSRAIHIDILFFNLTYIVFEEYKEVSKKLKYPAPALPPLPNDDYLKEKAPIV